MKKQQLWNAWLAASLSLPLTAFAAIDTGLDGEDEFGDPIPGSRNGTVFFSAYDPVAGVSYLKGLDLTYNTFQPVQGAPVSLSYDLSADADWLSFLGNRGTSGVLYTVLSLGDSGNGRNNFLSSVRLTGNPIPDATTLTADQLVAATTSSIGFTTNSQLSGFAGIKGYIEQSNPALDDVNNSAYRLRDGAADVQYFGFGLQENWAGAAPFNTTATVGTALGFAKLSPGANPDVSSDPVTIAAYQGYWNLSESGTLSYTGLATAPIPEPGTWALMGLGLAGLGVVARRRKALA